MRIGLVVNHSKPLASAFVPDFVQWLAAQGCRPLLADTAARALRIRAFAVAERHLVSRTDLVVAIGGDGTLLRAARLVGARETPIMGINVGGLGFLTEFSLQEARDGILQFRRGRHVEEHRMLLKCRCGKRTGYVLNDCALNMGASGRVIEVLVHSDRLFVNRFVGDGIVIATPTGSTAYSLAAGGPVVHPTMQAILLTPLCPHALAARPVILPGDAKVQLELAPGSEAATLNLDGQTRWPVQPGRPVVLSRARFCVRLVTPQNKTCFQILRDKLKWSGSPV
uniref:NAD kinase n=1 Tax=candidate division WOR-3 bacterium TaxID=2052148 RepID=A0A7C4CE85_UNCW3